MSASCCHSQSASRLFSLFARSSRRRAEKKGLESTQQQLLAGLTSIGFDDASLLEIGCGVGHLHQTLLEKGARQVVGVDLAPRMLAEARSLAADRGLAERVEYVEGDFIELGDAVGTADIALLDKVVCCYPDADGLLGLTLKKTRRGCALTYPRDRWFVRLWMGAWNGMLWLLRSDFRTYVHAPAAIERRITDAGFVKRYEDTTAAWLTQVYARP
ncbi:MAG: class I SAM-dependent methyltransferase [Woeseiaceae bacterium]|nr:class I SAM-dependent methyltransferase [Woeseiaceae bacterium]